MDIERAQVECVFALGGGELHVPHPDFPDEFEGIFKYWYEGQPSYEREDHDCEYRTVVACAPIHKDPEGWKRVKSFTSSGEAQCWHCEGDEQRHEDVGCRLCENDGYVYLGEGWAEVVFKRIEAAE